MKYLVSVNFRLQGPLVTQSTNSWCITSVAEYFLMLPYAGILLAWFSRYTQTGFKGILIFILKYLIVHKTIAIFLSSIILMAKKKYKNRHMYYLHAHDCQLICGKRLLKDLLIRAYFGGGEASNNVGLMGCIQLEQFQTYILG